MGAHNSTPQTLRTENPQHNLTMQVKPFIEGDQGNQGHVQEKTKKNPFEEAQAVFDKTYNELQEHQFEESVEKVKAMIGEPLALTVDVNEKLTALRVELINCYNSHPYQTLICAGKAKLYQDFIYYERNKAIQKFCELTSGNRSSTAPTGSE